MTDLPDWTTNIAITVVDEAPEYPTEVVGRPTCRVRTRNPATTVTGSMTTIVERTITDGKYFVLGKILVTWPGTDEQHIKVKLGDEIVGEYYATAYVIDWWAHHVKLLGDGAKKVLIKAQAISTGAVMIGFINGEEV